MVSPSGILQRAVGRRLYRSPAMREALNLNIATFDIVHLHSVFLWPTSVAAQAARKAGVPYVLSPRGMLVGGSNSAQEFAGEARLDRSVRASQY